MLEGHSYYAFVSYSHRDEKWARWLHRSIESYRLPRSLIGQDSLVGNAPQRLNPLFRDRDELPTASDLGEVIRGALAESCFQIVICSPAAAQSRWVNEEILAFKRLGREERILCLIVDGEPNAGDERECFPEALRFKLGTDGELTQDSTEPIAADARPGKDRRNAAKLKLIAGMLGVGYDTLRQRELHRRNRRMALITSAAVGGMIVTTGLAAAALIARSEAENQRQRAEAEAETARQTTSFLVDLFNVSDPSEALGNSITAREILDRGAEKIALELADQPVVQARLMVTMGTVYRSLGLYGDAGGLLDEALTKRQAILGTKHPDVAASLAELGALRRSTADYVDAEASYREAIEIWQASAEPDLAALASARSGLGDVLSEQGRVEEAARMFESALNTRREIFGDAHLLTARSKELLAISRIDEGRLVEAEALMREAVATIEEVIEGDRHPQLADTLNNLAFTLLEQGKFDEAQRLFERSLEMNRLLLGDVHPTVAIGINNLAFIALRQGSLAQAEIRFREVIEMNKQLLGEDHPEVANGLMNLAVVLYDREERDAAFATAYRSLEIYRAKFPDGHPDTARVLTNLGSWHGDVYEYESAEPLLEEALAMKLELLEPDNISIAFTRAPLASVLLETNRADDARREALLARETFVRALPVGHWRVAWAKSIEAAAMIDLGETGEAGPQLLAAYDALLASNEARANAINNARRYLINYFRRIGRDDQALALSTSQGVAN